MLRTLVPGTTPYRIFHLRWLRLTGAVSYGAYVFHDIPHDEYHRLVAHYFHHGVTAITAVLGIVMTLALSFLSYHFFELSILRLKDRFTSSNAGRVLAPNSSDTSEIAAHVLHPHPE
jgi:peptidoglycan/LPS O-acetylase OafA/YrhL